MCPNCPSKEGVGIGRVAVYDEKSGWPLQQSNFIIVLLPSHSKTCSYSCENKLFNIVGGIFCISKKYWLKNLGCKEVTHKKLICFEIV
jgi:hypothetical protein